MRRSGEDRTTATVGSNEWQAAGRFYLAACHSLSFSRPSRHGSTGRYCFQCPGIHFHPLGVSLQCPGTQAAPGKGLLSQWPWSQIQFPPR